MSTYERLNLEQVTQRLMLAAMQLSVSAMILALEGRVDKHAQSATEYHMRNAINVTTLGEIIG